MTQRLLKSDAEIQKAVLEELKWDGRVLATDVGVEVNEGVVTLTGRVDSFAKREAAQKAAHRVMGVLDVANDIQIHIPHTFERTDTEIAQAVRQALEWDVFVPHEKIQSTVSNGLVTLTGAVDRWVQRDEAYHAVSKLSGVRGVVNNIRVLPLEQPTPEKVRETIEKALARRAEREAKRISVTVTGGEVTLSGPVHSWQEREAVVESAANAPGVSAIRSQLIIQPELQV
jgi:osmotically-inducible protein OsmY